MHAETWVFGVVLVAGLALVGVGFATPDYVEGLGLEAIEGDAVDEDAVVVAYENLSTEERSLFDQAQSGDGSVEHRPGKWTSDADFVRYDGQYYEVTIWGNEGNTTFYFVAGWGLAGLAVVGVAVVRGVRRLLGGERHLFSA